MCRGQKLPRMGSPVFPAKQKRHLDTESTILSGEAQRHLGTRHHPCVSQPGAQPGGGKHSDQT